MQILPDKNFKANYKKRYNANYEKLMSRRQERAERKARRTPEKPEVIKQRLVGGFVFSFVALVVIFTGYYLSGIYSDKESEIQALENEIQSLDSTIREYQIINSDEKYEQIEEAVQIVTDLQNQYVTGNIGDVFNAYAVRYLGQYNENWADDVDNLTNPVWKGYLDKSGNFRDSASMLFILYDKAAPIVVVSVKFGIDSSGNLSEMVYADKVMLV